MIAAIACCPCTALLVPDVGRGAALETDSLRADCDAAVAAMVRRVDAVTVIGPALHAASLADLVPGLALPAFAPLPLPHALGTYLLARSGWTSLTSYLAVDGAGVAVSGEFPAPDLRVGLLVIGDGSARRGEKAPGYFDDRAAGFDTSVLDALGSADVLALAKLDAQLGVELLAAGVGPWKALARIAADHTGWESRILYSGDPFGVSYFVASWLREMS
jgi:hypothetical protein